MRPKSTLVICWLLAYAGGAFAQRDTSGHPTEIPASAGFRGQILDKSSGQPIVWALVSTMDQTPSRSVQTDSGGYFALEVRPGRQRLAVSAQNYSSEVVAELIAVAGKETEVIVRLEENASAAPSVLPNPNTQAANQPKLINPFTLISGQVFTIEEVNRYAGSLADPSRMASSKPGVFNTDDTQNYIIARGNSPMGVAYYIEGVPVENPNHFATLGNTGAPFTALNTNSLSNSDLVTGVFAAEYGNSPAAVFDLHLRRGNNRRREFTAQISLLGAEFNAETPLGKKGASLLVAYRYSIFTAMQALGLPVGTSSNPTYQDLTFKLHMPTRRYGQFSLFGVGGWGKASVLDKNLIPNDLFAERNRNLYVQSGLAVVGAQHKYFLNRRTSVQTTLALVGQDYFSYRDSIALDSARTLIPFYQARDMRYSPMLGSTIQSKRSSKLLVQAGARVRMHYVGLNDRFLQTERIEYLANHWILHPEAFAQSQYKPSPKLTISAGLYGYYYALNRRSWGVEPRLSAQWRVHARHTVLFGYGLHSKIMPASVLFNVRQLPNGRYDTENQQLAPYRSHHLVVAHRYQLNPKWQLHTEAYAQYLTNIPIERQAGTFSYINYGEFPIFPQQFELINRGLAYNAGIEATLQRSFQRGFYLSASGSYFTSRYQASDKVWRNTVFNTRYLAQVVAGREFPIGRQRRNLLTVDIRYSGHGRRPYVPILLDQSIARGYEVRDNQNPYTAYINAYNRLDIKVGARFNGRYKRVSHLLFLDVINALGFQNEVQKRYNPVLGQVATSYQLGVVPNLFYQVQF